MALVSKHLSDKLSVACGTENAVRLVASQSAKCITQEPGFPIEASWVFEALAGTSRDNLSADTPG